MTFVTVPLFVLAVSVGLFASAHVGAAPIATLRSAPKCDEIGPKKLPSVDVLFDSSALMTRLKDVHGAEDVEDTVNVRFTNNPGGRILGAGAPTPSQYEVVAAVTQSLRPPTKGTPDYARVRVRHGATPTVALARSVLCAPVPEGATVPSTQVRVVVVKSSSMPSRSGPPASAGMGTSITVRLLVTDRGDVSQVEFVGSSGNTSADDSMRQQYSQGKYLPATLDGAPIAVWLAGKNVEIAK